MQHTYAERDNVETVVADLSVLSAAVAMVFLKIPPSMFTSQFGTMTLGVCLVGLMFHASPSSATCVDGETWVCNNSTTTRRLVGGVMIERQKRSHSQFIAIRVMIGIFERYRIGSHVLGTSSCQFVFCLVVLCLRVHASRCLFQTLGWGWCVFTTRKSYIW